MRTIVFESFLAGVKKLEFGLFLLFLYGVVEFDRN